MPELIIPRREPMLAIRGHGKVQIFDERTGKLRQEERFENFITNETKKYMKWMARKVFWAGISGTVSGRVAGDPGANYSVPGPWDYYSPPMADLAPFYNMTHLVLTDNTAAEDPANESYLHGNIKAWANKGSYIGTDVLRGSQNLTEDYADATTTRWVFDWPTNAGNGTFQSVAWAALNENNSPAFGPWMRVSDYVVAPAFGQPGTPYSNGFYGSDQRTDLKFDSDDANNRIIADIYNNPLNHHQIWHAPWDLSNWTLMFDREAAVPGSSGPLAVAGSSIYLANTNYTISPCLVKTDFSGTVLATLASTWNALLGVNSWITDVSWDGTYLWVVGEDGSFPKAWQINPNTGAIISTIDVTGLMNQPTTIAVSPSGDVFISDGYQWCQFSAGGTLKARLTTFFVTSSNYCAAWRNSGGVTSLYSSGNRPFGLQQLFLNNLGARTLLGAPVTKANTQTMKVVYEFDFS